MSPSIDRTLECMLECMFLAFFGFLRCSEFAPSTSAFNRVIHPSLSDISAHTPDSLIYTEEKQNRSIWSQLSFTYFASTPSSAHTSHFQNMLFPDMPIILLLEILSFLQNMEKWPRDPGLTSTFKRFSTPPAYLLNTTPYIPSGSEQPLRPPAQASRMKP